MAEGKTKSSNEGSKNENAKVEYINNEVVDKLLEKYGISVDCIIAEFNEKEIDQHNSTSSGSNSGNSGAAGSHTKVETTAKHKLKYLFQNGYIELATKEQTPKIKSARKSEKEESDKGQEQEKD